MDEMRSWHFNFSEYYDVVIWDNEPGNIFSELYNDVQTTLVKAHRFQVGVDLYRPSGSVLKTIVRDEQTGRTRDVKPGEKSLWDILNPDDTRFQMRHFSVSVDRDGAPQEHVESYQLPEMWKYTEADMLEDQILFPWEQTAQPTSMITGNESTERSDTVGDGPDFHSQTHNGRGVVNDTRQAASNGTASDSAVVGELPEETDSSETVPSKITTIDKQSNGSVSKIEKDETKEPGPQRKMHRFENSIKYVMKRFVFNLDTDEELPSDCDSDCDNDCDHVRSIVKLPDEEIDGDAHPEALQDEDWEDEQESDDDDDTKSDDSFRDVELGATPREAILQRMQSSLPATDLEDADRLKEATIKFGFPGAESWHELWENLREVNVVPGEDATELLTRAILRKHELEQEKKTKSLAAAPAASSALTKQRKKPRKLTKNQEKAQAHAEMSDEFELYMDREKAACFKDCWHKADLESGAQVRWSEYSTMMKALHKWADPDQKGGGPACTVRTDIAVEDLMDELGIPDDCHHKVVRDMYFAYNLCQVFFGGYQSFFNTPAGQTFKHTNILNQEQRVKTPPDHRSPHSSRYRPEAHWTEWDTVKDTRQRDQTLFEILPKHWEPITRPSIAHLYREGVIVNSYNPGASGMAICLTEPLRPGKPDLYFDWRHFNSDVRMPRELQDPFSITPFPEQATRFALSHPNAVFSVLKIWSAPHFYPLMLGYHNRSRTSFSDSQGMWEWKFVPKDMPFSEWSVHHTLRGRVEEYEWYFRGRVVVKRHRLLVLAGDWEECRLLTTLVVWAVQTRPWRLEVDPWKSWMGVSADFLGGVGGGVVGMIGQVLVEDRTWKSPSMVAPGFRVVAVPPTQAEEPAEYVPRKHYLATRSIWSY
ncbi:hypothetical protein KVT40_005998 [Elsinoe batatas]|uniref:Uncharacterized protein n=1 Tax=Elsinoe batatas TaxID=2601811 RepID=A0A8K0KY89_9PEZI|nr:hypothetical protein KVT40_005998 [Elsinoe batatas]